MYVHIIGNQRAYIGVILSGRKMICTSKIGNLSRIPNLASEIGALRQIFRDIDVFGASPEAALLGATLEKSVSQSVTTTLLRYQIVPTYHKFY